MVQLRSFFFQSSHIYKFSPTQKKSGPLQRPGASGDRKHHSVKKTDKKCRGKNLMLANKLIKHIIDIFLFFFLNDLSSKWPKEDL